MKNYLSENHLTEAGFAFVVNTRNAGTQEFITLIDHIENCDQCKFEHLELNDLMLELNDFQVPLIKKSSYLIKIAAAVILMISSYFIYTSISSNDQIILNNKYELMIGDELRSPLIKVSPEPISTLKNKAIFIFEKGNKKEIELNIIDVNEKLILRKTPLNNSIIIHKSDLSKGIYYWKIETPDELLKVGKLIVD